jgi:hypothetical protein
MDINEPNNSRQLAILIQGLRPDEKTEFLKEARRAKDMESFIKYYMENFG